MEQEAATEAPDGALAVAAILGDLDAFGELARRYRRAVVRIAAAIAGADAAEDIAQDALLLAFRALPDLDEPDRFAAWLSAITRNRAYRWLRQENREVRLGLDDALVAYIDAVAARDRSERGGSARVLDGLEQLPEEYALVMRLRWMDELSMAQIAAFTGLPLSTVKWRLHDGKRRLREWSEPAAVGHRKKRDPEGSERWNGKQS